MNDTKEYDIKRRMRSSFKTLAGTVLFVLLVFHTFAQAAIRTVTSTAGRIGY